MSIDSGVEMSEGKSSDEMPQISSVNQSNESVNIQAIEEDFDDDDFDESFVERLWGLTEMFPESVRNGVSRVTCGAMSGAKSILGLSRNVIWVMFTSTAILIAPIALEIERSQVEEYSKQQQRQILLGPSAAMSSGGGTMGMMPPIQSLPSAPR